MNRRLARSLALASSGLILGGSLAGCRPPAQDAEGAKKAEAARSIGVTRVRLDFVDRPAAEILAALGERSGFPVVLGEPEGRRRPATDPTLLNLSEPEPVAFWEALERVIRPAWLQVETVHGVFAAVEVELGPLRGVRSPVFIDGAFRCQVLSLDLRRTLALGTPAPPNTEGRPVPTRDGESGPDVGPTLASFRVRVQIRPEPRPGLKLVTPGTPRVLEATDDRGRSLVVAEPETRGPGGAHLVMSGLGSLVAELPLAMPDPPGTSIVKLEGVAPFVLQCPRPDALDVPLAAAAGKSFEGSGARLTISRCELVGSGRAADAVVELAFRSEATHSPSPNWRPELDAISFQDQDGKVVLGARSARPGADGGTQLTYHFPGRLPARLRYSGSIEASVAVHFEFADLPLP